jgi:hypothetical protein
MMLAGTLAILALWLAFVWFADPDGFRDPKRRRGRAGPDYPKHYF